MNCFYHPETVAVGLCKSCSRGICPDCATDIGTGLACKDKCEERAMKIDKLIDANEQALKVSNKQVGRNAYLFVAMGILFCIPGLLAVLLVQEVPVRVIGMFLLIFGIVNFVRGMVDFKRSARYPTLKNKE